jgi:hypothetical protein
MNLSRIQYHGLITYGWEFMHNFKTLEKGLLWQYIFKQFAQGRNIPLTISQLVHEIVFGVLWFDLECFIKGFIRSHDTEFLVENKHRFMHDVNHRLDIRPAFFPDTIKKICL